MLIYTGKGFWAGIPARDLTDEEVERIGEEKILLTGDYARPREIEKPKQELRSSHLKEH
jgi:hypothetical protein